MGALGPIVSAAWLAGHRDEVTVADVRWYLDGRSGLAAFEAGHLPGAVHVDMGGDLSGVPGPAVGRHPLPEPADFAAAMSRLGIGDDTTVVAYDDAGGSVAARLVWMLRAVGRPAALLDGGLSAWSGRLDTGAPAEREPASFTAVPWPTHRLADIDEVATVSQPGSALVVLDARPPERYRGEVEPVDPRAGHIPARNLPFVANLDPDDGGRFRSPDDLRACYEAVGAVAGADVVVSCGSGVTACHDLLALEQAGLGPGRLFVGSWSQWSNDPARPAATGPSATSAPEGPVSGL